MKNSNFGKFMLLWAGELISSIGGGLTSFGLGVYVFNQTGSAAGMAIVTLLGFLPTLILSVPAGVLADRYDRRILMMIGDGCSGLGIIYILICMMTGEASLWQICLGVFVSAAFSALLEPSYRATISDMLTKEEFSKASGLVSLAGSARYLFSPVLAGLLLSLSDVKLLLIIDICTFFITLLSTAVVRKNIEAKTVEKTDSFMESMKEGWRVLRAKKGVLLLVLVTSAICLFMGMFQVLAEPFFLSFTDAGTLGIAESVSACGMLVSGVFLGIKGIKKHYVRILSISLAFAGVNMALFGLKQDAFIPCIFGFLFFASLPFANNCLDYLTRTNIPTELQGRVWGMIGFLSQLGYVIAYGISGIAADLLGNVSGGGVGRGAGIVMLIAGICLALIALSMLSIKSIKALETHEEGEDIPVQSQISKA
ncbi:MAG: MFS transporter [Lachnospiraceae bacterium]|nr:MFS transporter [Lachnospiraceae bacterium]